MRERGGFSIYKKHKTFLYPQKKLSYGTTIFHPPSLRILSLFLCAPLYKLSRAYSFFYKQKIYAFHPRTKIKLNGCRFPSRHGEQLERNKWDFSPSHPIFYRVLQKKNVYLDVVTCTLKIVAIALSFLKNLWGFNSPAFNGNRDLMQCNTMLVPLFYLRNKN